MLASQWTTPRAITGGPESAERKQSLGRTESGGGDLQAQALLWATPTSHPRTHAPRRVDHGEQLANQVDLWATPTTRDWKDTPGQTREDAKHPTSSFLGLQAPRSGIGGEPSSPAGPTSPRLWKTPHGIGNQGRTGNIGGASEFQKQVRVVTGKKRLSVLFVTWLMNFPLGWVDLAPLDSTSFARWETPSCLPAPPTPS